MTRRTTWRYRWETDRWIRAHRIDGDPYGSVTMTRGGTPQTTDPLGQHWTFTGRFLDEESGLLYYRARYYDTERGRFVQRDPLGYSEGPLLFSYVASSPVNRRDPGGLHGGLDYNADRIEELAAANAELQDLITELERRVLAGTMLLGDGHIPITEFESFARGLMKLSAAVEEASRKIADNNRAIEEAARQLRPGNGAVSPPVVVPASYPIPPRQSMTPYEAPP